MAESPIYDGRLGGAPGNMAYYNTLDEPVSETIMRDLRQVGSKLKIVLMPKGDQEGVLKKLKEWDLWGPLLVCLVLSIMLSSTAPANQGALVFASVFVVVWCGAAMVTVNAQLLGGGISFFQSVCVLGYCVFPLVLASAACLIAKALTGLFFIRALLVVVGFMWSTRASVVFIKQIISPERKVLAVYPVFFFYAFLSWMVLLQ
ncbi:terbinafine resistance locus protein [Tribonema minus]|uniref:Protein YIPF n=1 Tax=Tribonema minus TaxID=303371 RepID=A0A836CPM4_9STRA|nr:terbinafine resistance locus protein [Tribonema minus]|eukprot:TRINITY_DN10624_c0_g1_i1.p2 TRINITY_DN10624_c0_g1~~TRINITY_DN10624_c0_g1_i1.p2  ORF type:complete len:203 (+),score=53.33 TRINITY_DN10624_c0_g1_i1:103-711(+)